jgi:hypothetical protein
MAAGYAISGPIVSFCIWRRRLAGKQGEGESEGEGESHTQG